MIYNIRETRVRRLIQAFLLLLIPVTIGCEGLLEPVTYDTCSQLAPAIIQLSEDDNNVFQPHILKIYAIEEVSKDLVEESFRPDNLHCRGNAMFSSGETDEPVIFHMTTDQDGDSFIGYESVDPWGISDPTAVPVKTPRPGATLVPSINQAPEVIPTPAIEPTPVKTPRPGATLVPSINQAPEVIPTPAIEPTPVFTQPRGTIGIGSSYEEVETILGVPNGIRGGNWSYPDYVGSSNSDSVSFDEDTGQVSAWSNLWGSLSVHPGAAPMATEKVTISEGSSKSEVLEILGMPDAIDDGGEWYYETWEFKAVSESYYEVNTVGFDENGFVYLWQNIDGLMPVSINIIGENTGTNRIKLDATMGDVLRLQGMPNWVEYHPDYEIYWYWPMDDEWNQNNDEF